jgi:hypothetical protein
MVTMALFAARGIGIIHKKRLSVNSPCVICHGLCVTASAIDRIKVIRMWKTLICCIRMAGDAAIAVVDRIIKDHGVYEYRYGSAVYRSFQAGILMTHDTIFVRLCGQNGKWKTCEQDQPDKGSQGPAKRMLKQVNHRIFCS